MNNERANSAPTVRDAPATHTECHSTHNSVWRLCTEWFALHA